MSNLGQAIGVQIPVPVRVDLSPHKRKNHLAFGRRAQLNHRISVSLQFDDGKWCARAVVASGMAYAVCGSQSMK